MGAGISGAALWDADEASEVSTNIDGVVQGLIFAGAVTQPSVLHASHSLLYRVPEEAPQELVDLV